MTKEEFLALWKNYPSLVDAATLLGVPLDLALKWVREERERGSRVRLEGLLERLLYLSADLRRRYEADELPPALIPHVAAFLRGLPALEEAYEVLLTEERR